MNLRDSPARRRLSPRFSLRVLLVAVTVAAAAMGFWKALIAPYRVQREAKQVFQHAGATVTTRHAAPAWVRRFAGDDALQTIIRVDLENCNVTDACLAWLLRLPDLEEFTIGRGSPGAAQATVERSLEEIEYLNLSGTAVTDDGLAHLAGCSRLKTLFLNRTRVSDAGLRRLKVLKSLRFVWLVETEVTPESVRNLQAALPETYIGY